MARKFTNRIRGRWSEITAKAKAVFTCTKPRRLSQKKIPNPQATNTSINGCGAMHMQPNAPIDIPSVMYWEVADTRTSHLNPPFREASVCSAKSTAAVHTSEKEYREPSVFEDCMYCSGDNVSNYCDGDKDSDYSGVDRDSDTDSWTSEVFSEDSEPDFDVDYHKHWHLRDDFFLVDNNPFTDPVETTDQSPRS
ncbi:hypothetical protein LZ30DRAFT_685195 [Colletotrichum cereale]|nr:hypothetical protein LZ30DRAFT_685195 [Colletotrichum cereale]